MESTALISLTFAGYIYFLIHFVMRLMNDEICGPFDSCTNTPAGGYTCTCENGYELTDDAKACQGLLLVLLK